MAISITDDDAFAALRAFLMDVLPGLAANGGVNVRQGQQNDVPMPPGPDFIILTPISRAGLSTTVRDYFPSSDPAPALGVRETTRQTQVGVFVNFYGPSSTDNAQIFNTLFRDLYGCDFLRPYHVQPLSCDDGKQMPLTDGERQYEQRWLIQAYLQINPTVSTAQEFADTTDVDIVKAD